MSRSLVVALLVLVAGPSTPALQPADAKGPSDPIDRQLAALDERLAEARATRACEPLFASEHPDIARMQVWFALLEKTVHGARKARAEGEEIPPVAADDFHGALTEYRLNIEELEPNGVFGETKTPKAAAKKKLLEALDGIRALADGIPGLQQASKLAPGPRSSAAEAVHYARRCLTEVRWLLDNRTLAVPTSQGRQASLALRDALDAVWRTLDETLDEDGMLAPRESKDGRPLADQLEPFKAAMREARTQAEFYRRLYLPNVRRDAHRRRAQRIEELLAGDGFEKRYTAVKALREPAAEPLADG
jgi:hypothetical protein